MKKYTVYYRDKSGDLSHVWTEAEDKSDAIKQVKHDFWDAETIVDVEEMKW